MLSPSHLAGHAQTGLVDSSFCQLLYSVPTIFCELGNAVWFSSQLLQVGINQRKSVSVPDESAPHTAPDIPSPERRDKSGREGAMYVRHALLLLQIAHTSHCRDADYDLVRIYHPDSPSARAGGVPAETAHARFQAIAAAYAILTGKKPATALDGTNAGEGFDRTSRPSYHDLSTEMWRARQRKRAELDIGLDDRWKERLMTGAVFVTLALFVLQTYTTRTQALSDARQGRRAVSRDAASSSPPPDVDDAQRLSLDASKGS
ncbi:hypothetical protein BN946_scf184969.g65 [Trametes cinnabarina]|uniref:J domain-containing protein n=1 Tax=Pycnoporus cinnabarinus TaxID=5643 RepID=A0A060SZM9_PYCCI|nr:hypothetical protein BN946_scf184969.g65 [Trametes cinnabarina]